MVYDDLMIRNNTVTDYNINRSRPVTVRCIYSKVGAPVDRRRLTGLIWPNRTLISVRIIVPFFRTHWNLLWFILDNNPNPLGAPRGNPRTSHAMFPWQPITPYLLRLISNGPMSITNHFRGNLYIPECHITPPQYKRAPKTSDHSKVYPKYFNGNLHMKKNRCEN